MVRVELTSNSDVKSTRTIGAVRQPDEQPAVDALVAALQAALRPDALEVALERGRRTEPAAAVELAMAAARSRSS